MQRSRKVSPAAFPFYHIMSLLSRPNWTCQSDRSLVTRRVQQQREAPLVVFLRTRTLQSRGPGYRDHGVSGARFYAEQGYSQTPPCPQAVRLNLTWQPFLPNRHRAWGLGGKSTSMKGFHMCEPRFLRRQGQRLKEKQRGRSISGVSLSRQELFRAKINTRCIGKGVGEIRRPGGQPTQRQVANTIIPPSPNRRVAPHRLRPTGPSPQPRDERAPRGTGPDI